MKKNKKDVLPESFKSAEEAADFWDSHELTDYLQDTREAELNFHLKRRHYFISVAPELFNKIQSRSYKEHLSVQALTHAWLKEKLRETRRKKEHAVKEERAKYSVKKAR